MTATRAGCGRLTAEQAQGLHDKRDICRVQHWLVQAMRFGDKAKQPSIATLERYGNTSASSTFYIMAYIEHHQGVQRGDKVISLHSCSITTPCGNFAGSLYWPQVRRAVHEAATVLGILDALLCPDAQWAESCVTATGDLDFCRHAIVVPSRS